MKLIATRTIYYEDVIKELYLTDQDLLDKYHVLAPTTYEEAVKDTIETLAYSVLATNYEMWQIRIEEKLVAYFGIEYMNGVSLLTGYFILPEYRNAEFIPKFFSIIKSKMPRTFFTALYEKNKRAINFLKKNNFVEDGQVLNPKVGQNMLIFKYN